MDHNHPFLFTNRADYEVECEQLKITPLADDLVAEWSATGFERLLTLIIAHATSEDLVVLATHLRRGRSLNNSQPEATAVGTLLLN